MNEFVYAEEAQDAIDNMAQDQDYGDFLESQWSDGEADADTFASAGWGTDEDYGYFGGEDSYLDTYWESLSEM